MYEVTHQTVNLGWFAKKYIPNTLRQMGHLSKSILVNIRVEFSEDKYINISQNALAADLSGLLGT